MFNSPSTPPSSTSTRDTATLDGWTIKILLALAGYLDSVGHALSDVPGHLRWLADGTDLVRLLGLEQPSPPVDCSPSQGPVVARSVAEIRADLALADESERWSERYHDAIVRLLHDVDPLLSEVAAAHRFEQSAASDSARLAAVEALIEQARKVSPSGSMTVYVGDLEVALGRRPDSVRGIVGQNDGAAADAPQPAEPMTLSCVPTGCQCSCHRSGGLQSAHIVACCNPSPAQPADPPTKETQR